MAPLYRPCTSVTIAAIFALMKRNGTGYQQPMDAIALNALFLVLTGPVAGSFFGLVADRLPRGQSTISPGSTCQACQTRLSARDLVPILSFALARGRCRHCNVQLPSWLLYVELIATGLAVFAVILAPTVLLAWAFALFLWLLMALSLSDLLHFRLPDLLTGALLIVALFLSWLTGAPAFVDALIGSAIGAAAFFVIRLTYRALREREGLGLGDVKLMAGLGAALGWYDLPLMVLLAALASLAAALIGTISAGKSALSPTRALPFGAALCAATAALWIAQKFPV